MNVAVFIQFVLEYIISTVQILYEILVKKMAKNRNLGKYHAVFYKGPTAVQNVTL